VFYEEATFYSADEVAVLLECEASSDQPTRPHLQRTDLVVSELVEVVDNE
jgi:hypothetical protein